MERPYTKVSDGKVKSKTIKINSVNWLEDGRPRALTADCGTHYSFPLPFETNSMKNSLLRNLLLSGERVNVVFDDSGPLNEIKQIGQILITRPPITRITKKEVKEESESKSYTLEFTFAQVTFKRVYTIKNNDFAKFYDIVSNFFTDEFDANDDLDQTFIDLMKMKFPELTKEWDKDMDDDYFTLCDFFQTNFVVTGIIGLDDNTYKICWGKGHEYIK